MLKIGMENTIELIVRARDERNQMRVAKGSWLPATGSYIRYRAKEIFESIPDWLFEDYKYEDDSVCTRVRHGDKEHFTQPLCVFFFCGIFFLFFFFFLFSSHLRLLPFTSFNTDMRVLIVVSAHTLSSASFVRTHVIVITKLFIMVRCVQHLA